MRFTIPFSTVTVAGLLLTACGGSDGGADGDLLAEAVTTYADGVHASYAASLESATEMDTAIDAFLDDPTDDTLALARDSWLDARDDYGPNEAGGETDISTGWHAIEFLLWGQDLSEDGPGDRPASDYVDAPNADRRGSYLATASNLLLVHLGDMVDAWDPAYSTSFALPTAIRAAWRSSTGSPPSRTRHPRSPPPPRRSG